MKRISLLFVYIALLGFTLDLAAQKTLTSEIAHIQAKKQKYRYTGMEAHEGEFVPSIHQLMYEQAAGSSEDVNQETWIGFTSYDLQTNAAPKRRLHGNADGIAAVWTYHPETGDPATTFPNRGSGYNSNFGGAFGGFPSARLEASTRTGWCNIVVTETGRELVISHDVNSQIVILKRDAGQSSWSQETLPTDAEPGLLWPNVAVSGNIVHVIALTTPVANDGALYEGQDGALLYYRSMDGGDSWAVQDFQVPGIGVDDFTELDGDSYSLHANGSNVVFTIFNGFGDVVALVSNDNGQTWNKRIVNDFPLDNYVADQGYTLEDIGGVVDPNAPDSLAIATSDGSGSVYVDDNGTVHVAYGSMYVIDTELTDGFTNFFPATNGIYYWNSNMNDGEPTLIEAVFDAIDVNGNDTLEAGDDLPSYGGGLTSMVDLIVSDEGDIIVAYSQHMENYLRDAVAGSANFPESQNYRHIYLTASGDNGATWLPGYDVTNPEVLFFPALLPQTEAVYPHLFSDGSNMVDITYQMDEEPGIFVYNDNGDDNDPVTSNTFAHWRFDMFEIFPELLSTSVEVEPTETFKFEINPNPATDNINISYELPSSARTQIIVSNVVGQQVMVQDNGAQADGLHNFELNVGNLAKGIYIVSLRTDDKVSSQRLVIN